MNLLSIGIFATVLSYVPWNMVFLLTQYFGIRRYILTQQHECLNIQKRISNFSEVGDNNKGQGYCIGKWYIAYITKRACSSLDIWMISTDATYKKLSRDILEEHYEERSEIITTPEIIKIYKRIGCFEHPWMRRLNISSSIEPRDSQKIIISKIISDFKKKNSSVVYLWGPPCTGKSMIGLLLAKQLQASYCNTLKPWQPNDQVSCYYSECDPEKNSPAILVFDEIDVVIKNIHTGITPHKNLPIEIMNKNGWNHVFDEIQKGMYPYLIVIMTSNCSPKSINDIDPSYLRRGRVDMIFEMNELIKED